MLCYPWLLCLLDHLRTWNSQLFTCKFLLFPVFVPLESIIFQNMKATIHFSGFLLNQHSVQTSTGSWVFTFTLSHEDPSPSTEPEWYGNTHNVESPGHLPEVSKSITTLTQHFLDGSNHLYMRVCPSVGRLVRRSDGRMVRNLFFLNVPKWWKLISNDKCNKDMINQDEIWVLNDI